MKSVGEGHILDIACGDGRFTIKYAKIGFDVVGVDFSLSAITRLKQRAKTQKLSTQIKGIVDDIRKFNFGKNAYECVACTDALHYFSDKDIRQIIERMKEATTKKGQIILHLMLVLY